MQHDKVMKLYDEAEKALICKAGRHEIDIDKMAVLDHTRQVTAGVVKVFRAHGEENALMELKSIALDPLWMAIAVSDLFLTAEQIAMCRPTFAAKNQDYGNTFMEDGVPGILLRMKDKLSRAQHLLTVNQVNVENESVVDTISDLRNYAIMGMLWVLAQHEQAAEQEVKEARIIR